MLRNGYPFHKQVLFLSYQTGNYFDIIGLGSCVSNVFAAAMRRAAPPSLANTAYVGLAFLHPEDGYVCDRDGSVSTDLNKETKRKEKEKQRREKETRERAREKKKYKNRELQAFLRAVLTEGRLVSINDKRARCWYIPSKDARTICIVCLSYLTFLIPFRFSPTATVRSCATMQNCNLRWLSQAASLSYEPRKS